MVSNSDLQSLLRVDAAVTHPREGSGRAPRLGPWTFELGRGEFLALLGPRGCGKTSLIRLLAGVLPLTAGQVSCREPAPGIVFGKPCLAPWRSVAGNVMLGTELRKAATPAAWERARFLLGSMGAAEYEDRREPHLPPGIAERAAVCRALVHRPALLLMDEPFRHVDPLTREQIWLDLQRLWSNEGFGAILATSEVAEAVHLGDRVAVMAQRPGEIVRIVPIELPRPRRLSRGMTPLLAEYGDVLRTILRAQGALP